MCLGLPFGMMIFSNVPSGLLKKILAVMLIFTSIRGIYISFFTKGKPIKISKCILNLLLFLGGIFQGAFCTGGPIVVIYVMRVLKNKRQFRVTLCALWFILNSIIVAKHIMSGLINLDKINFLFFILPFLFVGIITGNYAHYRLKNSVFNKIIYGVLLVSTIFLLL